MSNGTKVTDTKARYFELLLTLIDPSAHRNLDSNIKKNTGFIKKCKAGLGADAQTQLLNDIKKLSLEKYISEIVAGVLEGLQRCKTAVDVAAAVQVVSALHQRFPDTFTLLFSYHLWKSLAPAPKLSHQQLAQAGTTPEQRDKEEAARISRQRVLCRIATELWLAGALRNVEDGVAALNTEGTAGVGSKSGSSSKESSAAQSASRMDAKDQKDGAAAYTNFVYIVLRDLLVSDKEHVNLPILMTLVKVCGKDLTGITPRKSKTEEGAPATEQDESVVAPGQQTIFKDLFEEYFKSLSNHLVKLDKETKKTNRKNEALLFSRGELSEERQQQYEKLFKANEKLLASTQTVADCLDLEMPALEEEKEDQIGIVETSGGGEKEASSSIWEDEDDQMFYEQIMDLRTLVPKIFLENSKSKKKEAESESVSDASTAKPVDDVEGSADMLLDEADEEAILKSLDADTDDLEAADNAGTEAYLTEETLAPVETTPVIGSNPTNATKLDALLARLPNMCNREVIDQAAVEFCYLNSKHSRNRLIRTLVQVHRGRQDLIPYYSRLIATLNPFYPDIAQEVLTALEREFRGLMRKKAKDLSETRTKNIKFISELVKFGITPLPVIFHNLKLLLDDFAPHNIEVLCALLESCGRFLKRKSPAIEARLDAMLDILKRKKAAHHLEPRVLLMIENAYYQCNPPDQTVRQTREIPPIEQFIRKLLYLDLCKKNLESTQKLLRKLDWNDPSIKRLLLRLFTKVWKIKFSNIHLMATLVHGLGQYHSDFAVALVDAVIENIRLGMESNNFKDNQKRVAMLKYLGELYIYFMVDSAVIFNTLDTLISFGHELGRASYDRPSFLDAPIDCFRIRLVCTLLDTCGSCFDHGSSKIKLDTFLVLFQEYIFIKESVPLEIEFMIEDTFTELRPKLHRFETYEEAALAAEALRGPSVQPVIEESESESDDEDDEDDDEQEDDDDSSDEGEEDDDNEMMDDEEEEEEQAVVLTNQTRQEEPVDEDFEREYLKMMTESLESRKFERKHLTLDVAIPVLRAADRQADDLLAGNSDHVAFTLLTKKGNKQQIKTVGLPSDSALVINTRNQREAEREEQQHLKQLVLEYEVREEANQRAALEQTLMNQGFRLNYTDGSNINRRPQWPGANGNQNHHQRDSGSSAQHPSQNQRPANNNSNYNSNNNNNVNNNQSKSSTSTRWARNQSVGVGAGFGTESSLSHLGVDGYERRPAGGTTNRNNRPLPPGNNRR